MKAAEPRVQWARFIVADNQEVLDKLIYENEKIEEAVAILREASADPKLLYDYEMRIKGENDRIAASICLYVFFRFASACLTTICQAAGQQVG